MDECHVNQIQTAETTVPATGRVIRFYYPSHVPGTYLALLNWYDFGTQPDAGATYNGWQPRCLAPNDSAQAIYCVIPTGTNYKMEMIGKEMGAAEYADPCNPIYKYEGTYLASSTMVVSEIPNLYVYGSWTIFDGGLEVVPLYTHTAGATPPPPWGLELRVDSGWYHNNFTYDHVEP